MNKRFLQVMLLAGCAVMPLLASAGRDDDRRGFDNSIEWRDGPGTSIFFRYPGDRDWRRAPGTAHDVGDGWVIGTDRRNGGYGIYRWSGNDWHRMPGAAVEIGGSYNNPWVINDRGERFAWTGAGWREEYRGNRNGWNRNDRDNHGSGRYDNDDRWRDNNRSGWRDDRRR